MRTSATPVHPHRKLLVLAGILTLFGLSLGLVYVFRSTPYTMVAFLGLGQAAILAGGALFLGIVFLDLRARLHSVVEKRFSPGETVFKQGDYPDRLFLIGSGEAEVVRESPSGEEVVLARLMPGEFFGEMGILGDSPRSATVRATKEMDTLSIHRSYLDPMLSYLPAWREKVSREFSERSAMNRKLDAGGRED